ncbi:hypothetical protein V1260_15385 [Brachybacterium sp. J144]|uniref:hypothetical protein n=1 Tax=Brachybacterium sp. J144 TaxID=3116487 RepID=UPI002E793C7D|nr:hypothetical protein [Brachybacterium sp. J144]MEE1652164.1 hypothetical protein [Brachybacterium sp. J144]
MRELREESLEFPTSRGWRGRGTGRTVAVEPSAEALGTTVQICGYWPFAAGSVSPLVGVPLGLHLTRGFPICADPISYFLADLIANPSLFILGRPGLGKSTVIRRILAVYEAWGYLPLVLGDLKPDHVDLIRAQQGLVVEVGPGRNAVNPLDRGPLTGMLDQLPDELRRMAMEDLRQFQRSSAMALLQQAGRRPLTPNEETIVARALRILWDELEDREPVFPDLLRLLDGVHPDMVKAADAYGREESVFRERTQHLRDVLQKLGPDGPYGDLFSRQTTVPIALDRPFAFDLSSIEQSDKDLQAAVQVTCWAYGSAAVSAARRLARAGIIPEVHHVLVMDEMWRMLKSDPKLVHFVDDISRLNRTIGNAQIMCTHTMSDLKLSAVEDTEVAWGLVERAGMLILGGLAAKEMGNLATVFALSATEEEMITSWSSEATVDPETGQAAAPPGMGHFLLKIGKKPGTPLRTVLTAVERDVNDTNRSWAQAASRFRQMRARALRDEVNEDGEAAA